MTGHLGDIPNKSQTTHTRTFFHFSDGAHSLITCKHRQTHLKFKQTAREENTMPWALSTVAGAGPRHLCSTSLKVKRLEMSPVVSFASSLLRVAFE